MRKWLPLTAVCLGAFMLLVDVTIVMVALPDMAADMDTSFSALQWVMDVYALALAALLLGAGSLADRIGRRRVYLGGLGLFAAASLACGLAGGPAALIAFRAVQGIGGAAMFATTMALLGSAYQGRDRGIAFGVWGAVNGAAAAAGPIIGGLLTEHFGWRWIFFVNLPVCALAVYVTLRSVAESRDPRAKGLDLPGMAAFTTGAAAVTYALIRVGENGWTGAATLGLFGLGAAASAAFVLIELRSSRPMLDLSLFRSRTFVGVMAGALLLSGAAFSYLMYVSLWLQSAEGMGPVSAGLVLVPLSLAAFAVSAVAGRMLHGAPARLTIGGGLLLIGAGALLQAWMTDAGDGWSALVPGLVVTGLGVGMATPALAAAALGAVAPARAGMAGGALNTARQLGMALGIAVLGAVFQAGLKDGLGGSGQGPGTAEALASGRAGELLAAGPAARVWVEEAFASGLRGTFLVSGLMGLAGALVVLVLVRTAAQAPAPVPAAAAVPAPAGPDGEAAPASERASA
ncbi:MULTISPECIES: MFS transporter [unclassified Streptomyces]|uniref:MFS transporter n=1 Tax=unclassified Streptomyces TaxID=2593676 RepID=UPI0022573332|nr:MULTISPECIES: MFS transporter [unclassified Streptomyces]MCX5145305.1 DHA2 family efflux MFS transporter permease subunit [Streptomyces sp. NBC_00320]WSN48619.1 DHA2 family efflux MFS transporter permease subunit [Streptomyces sp. NBC_01296]